MAKRCANVCYNYSGRVSAAVSSALTGRILTEVGIFLIPFILYAGYLLITRAALTHRSSWPLRVVAWLLIAALAALAVAGSLQLAGHEMKRQTSIPFGPFLALGLLLTPALQRWLGLT